MLLTQRRHEPLRDVAGNQLRGRVFDRQQHAVVARKGPFPIAIAHAHAGPLLFDVDKRIACCQQHVMIEFVCDLLGARLQGDEVEDVEVLVQWSLDLDGGAVVVPVQTLALVPRVRDEMTAAEDEVVLGDAHLVAFGTHGGFRKPGESRSEQGNGAAAFMLPSRSATNKQAVTRSAVVPGLRECPSARSQRSRSANAPRQFSEPSPPAATTARARLDASSAAAIPHLRAISESGKAAIQES